MSNELLVGGDVLRLVTAGMTDNPLVLYREYLQNAADSIASRGDQGGRVRVNIDPIASQITILDDGTGLSPVDAARRLIPIGASTKNPRTDRGFRGIGRLSGLAFAQTIVFTTRARSSESVTQVTWDGRSLLDPKVTQHDLSTAIHACTSVRTVPEEDWPNRFFHVTINGVARHAASVLLNPDAARAYIAEVCPVPLSRSFPLAHDAEKFLATHTDYFVMDVRVNDDCHPIVRPFGQAIPLSDNYSAVFEQLETRQVPQLDTDEPAAVLWLAHTPYAGSIPRGVSVRGLRARAGNIQIGADNVFEHLFPESRFNGWCTGELHVLDNRLVPNGRRDYFEPGPHLRNLENHVAAIAHEISSRCRRASSQRNKLRAVEAASKRVACAKHLAKSGYLLPQDAAAMLTREQSHHDQLKSTLADLSAPDANLQEPLHHVGQALTATRAAKHMFNGLSPDTAGTLKKAFGAISESASPDLALDVIEAIRRRIGSVDLPSEQ